MGKRWVKRSTHVQATWKNHEKSLKMKLLEVKHDVFVAKDEPDQFQAQRFDSLENHGNMKTY